MDIGNAAYAAHLKRAKKQQLLALLNIAIAENSSAETPNEDAMSNDIKVASGPTERYKQVTGTSGSIMQKANFVLFGKIKSTGTKLVTQTKFNLSKQNLIAAKKEYAAAPDYDRFYDVVPEFKNSYDYVSYIQKLDREPVTSPAFLRLKQHFRNTQIPSHSLYSPLQGGMYTIAAKGLDMDSAPGTDPSSYYAPKKMADRYISKQKTTYPGTSI